MKSRIDLLEEAVDEIRKQMRWLRGLALYLAGIMTINLGVTL